MFNKLLLLLILLLIAGALFLGYCGLLPGFSHIFGANKPKDLGIRFTEEDLLSADRRTGIKIEILPIKTSPKESLEYSGKVEASIRFTSEELTASLNRWFKKWKYFPLSDIQMKINPDDTVEISGIFHFDRIFGYATAVGYDQKDVERVLGRLDILNTNPPFYLKGKGSVLDNKASLDLKKVEVGKFVIPPSWIEKNKTRITSFLEEDRIHRIPNAYVKLLRFEAETMKFEGTWPEVEITSLE